MDRALTAVYAEEMIRLQDHASLAAPISECVDAFSVEDAYRISREVLRRREVSGWRRVGCKIGFTNRTIWDQYRVYEPIFGYMYDQTVSWAGGRGLRDESRSYAGEPQGAELSLAGLVQPLIEPEIVFGLRATPAAADDPAALLDAIEWVGHGFEVVQCHFPDWKFAVTDTIADGGLHGRYVVGPRIDVADLDARELIEQLGTFRITLMKDGEVAAEGGGALVLDSPLLALGHLVKTLQSLPDHPPLEAGEIVTTGTLTTALPVTAGEIWSTRIDGLPVPGMSLTFIP